MTESEAPQLRIVKAAFGAENRARLIEQYFRERPASEPSIAWQHVYRLLLWIDQTTGLAHCYESDKSQPGKNWYGRSLAFHDWLATALKIQPSELAQHLDWLFKRATADLAVEVLRRSRAILATAERQRRSYASRGMPQPGEDPELLAVIREVIGESLSKEISKEQWQMLAQRIRQHLSLENKRKNLVGEGFEDVIASTVRTSPHCRGFEVRTRALLHEIPGFNRARTGDKPNRVDIVILRPSGGMRILATAKWSVRADREKQFISEHAEYLAAESDRQQFEYVFITNEFDPARLMRACEALAGNHPMFARVVHICPEAVRATYGSTSEASMLKVLKYIDDGRLVGIDHWLQLLAPS